MLGPSSNPTLRDVASAAGVSAKTVSRVLNNDPLVASATREHVQSVIAGLGYRPNPLARSLRKGRDETVGVVVDGIEDAFFARAAASAERVALDHGIMVIIASTHRRRGRERAIISELIQRCVAGLIVASIDDDHSYLAPYADTLVFIDREPRNLAADAVVVDDYGAGRQAVEHLIRHGHRRIAYIGDVLELATSKERFRGYEQALAAASIKVDAALVHTQCRTPEESTKATLELLALPSPPTAIFTARAPSSLGVVPVLHSQGHTDIALVSFGDFEMANSLRPAVTVVDHSPETIGRVAMQRLAQRLENKALPTETLTLPLKLIQRGSGELAPLVTLASRRGRGRPDTARSS
jgi:LacI family transcriptional regulator